MWLRTFQQGNDVRVSRQRQGGVRFVVLAGKVDARLLEQQLNQL